MANPRTCESPHPNPSPRRGSDRSQHGSLRIALAILAGACVDPPQYLPPGQAGSPQGVLEGSVTYIGQLPCTKDQHVVGAAVMLVFDTRLLPPPEGLGTTAATLGVVGGDFLFAGVKDRLTFNGDGSLWCPPDPASSTVTVTGAWTAGPLPAAVYEVRGFYDLDGNFDPAFSISKLPTKGDIGGGAVENAADVLLGKAPIYRKILLGIDEGNGKFSIPDEGSLIGGISVSLGLPLPLDLPVFYPETVTYSSRVCTKPMQVDMAPAKGTEVAKATMPSDYTLPVFSPDPALADMTEDSLIRITLHSGVKTTEVDAAKAPPFSLPVDPPRPFVFSWQDVNGDGSVDLVHDHIPASTQVPSLFPLSILAKLADTKKGDPPNELVAQPSPAVILQGVTIYQGLGATALWGQSPPASGMNTDFRVIVGAPPALLCLDPADATKHAKLLLSHLQDCLGHDILSDKALTVAALEKQFGRTVDVVEGCLPQGRYAMNLVYGTGQAWTVPNEAGVCSPLEPLKGDMCVEGADPMAPHRALLTSQDVVLTIGPPDHPEYCVMKPTPAECLPAK
jgi:hypothetical protein